MTETDEQAGWRPGSPEVRLPQERRKLDAKRLAFILLGLGLFAAVFFSPPWPVAIDPSFEPITSAKFSPDGLVILTSSEDGTARLSELEGRQIAILKAHSDAILSARFSPDDELILTASADNTARVWNLDGEAVAVLEGHEGAVSSAVVSPDGVRVLTASDDGTARLWDLEGHEVAVLSGHEGPLSTATFSPDGQTILTASADGTVRLWVREGRQISVLDGLDDAVESAVFSPDGTSILAWTVETAKAQLWTRNGESGAELAATTNEVAYAVFTPDSRHVLFVASDGSLHKWDPAANESPVLIPEGNAITSVAVSPDARWLATAREDGSTLLSDAEGKEIALLTGHTAAVTHVAFSPDSRHVLTGSVDGVGRLWELDGDLITTVPDGARGGRNVHLSREAQLALGLFLLAAVWWVFEVVPIGVTAVLIVVVQSLFLIRVDPDGVANLKAPFTDCFDPSVWFIFGSIMIGLVFTKTGLTRRIAYRMLGLVGEKTSMIYLGCFVLTSALTLIMAHTAVAATIFPLLMAIYALYDETGGVTKFGKGLFMGMAYVAGAGSIITLLGAARGAVALGFFREITGRDVGFFELTWYMLPVGVLMTFILWGYFMVVYRPERDRIPGLREKAHDLHRRLGGISRSEVVALCIVFGAIALLSARALSPADSFLQQLDKSAVILTSTILFFVFKILDQDDLEQIPWNIILLFGGAMSIGFCLWQTGAARWLALHWLVMFQDAHWLIFVLGVAFFVLIMTNFIMNVAAIAISMPVALVLAPYLDVSGEVVMFAALVTAGMPFLCLVGAAPNAIAYGSGQFTFGEFFRVGIPASAILLVVLAVFVYFIWPLMGMPVLTG